MTAAVLSHVAPPQVTVGRTEAEAAPRVRDRRRSARSAVVSGLVVFFVVSVGMSVAFETTRLEWREPEFGHRLTLVQKQPQRPLVVVIGTSRTQNAIAPAAMHLEAQRMVNFGQSGATPLKELLTLHRLLDAGVRPAAVVVELFPPALAVNGTDEKELRERAARLSLADVRHLAPFSEDPGALWQGWLAARVNPLHSQRQVLMSHFLARWQPWQHRLDFQWNTLDAHGFQAVADVSPERRELLTAAAKREWADALIGFRPGESSVRAVRELIAVCRVKQIPVAFLVPPISPGFRAAFSPGVLESADAYLRELAGELRVPVFSAWADGTEDEFMDGHHMLKHGAERYSRWLAETHLKPWLTSVVVAGLCEAGPGSQTPATKPTQ